MEKGGARVNSVKSLGVFSSPLLAGASLSPWLSRIYLADAREPSIPFPYRSGVKSSVPRGSCPPTLRPILPPLFYPLAFFSGHRPARDAADGKQTRNFRLLLNRSSLSPPRYDVIPTTLLSHLYYPLLFPLFLLSCNWGSALATRSPYLRSIVFSRRGLT